MNENMMELNETEIANVDGGIAFVGWVVYGAVQVGMAAARAAISNPRATAVIAGAVAGWLSE